MPGSDVANDYTDEQIETLAQLAYEARPRDNWEQFVDECQEAAVALTSPKPAKTLYEVVLALHLNAEALSDTLRELLQRDEDLQFLLRTRHGRTGKTQALLSDINGFANAARLAIKRERVRRRGRGNPRSDGSLELFLYHLATAWMVARGTSDWPGTSRPSPGTSKRRGPFVAFLDRALALLRHERGAIGRSYDAFRKKYRFSFQLDAHRGAGARLSHASAQRHWKRLQQMGDPAPTATPTFSATNPDAAYDDGYRARDRGEPIESNPHVSDAESSDLHLLWRQGWRDSDSPSELANLAIRLPAGSSFRLNYPGHSAHDRLFTVKRVEYSGWRNGEYRLSIIFDLDGAEQRADPSICRPIDEVAERGSAESTTRRTR